MSRDSSMATNSVQEYWISGFGLSKAIVIGQLAYFLGPSATVRPYTFQGREGYKIVGSRLTESQLADLKRQSKEYERQETNRLTGGRPFSGEGRPEDVDINSIILVPGPRQIPAYNSSYRYSR